MSLFIEGPAKAGLVAGVMGTFFFGAGPGIPWMPFSLLAD